MLPTRHATSLTSFVVCVPVVWQGLRVGKGGRVITVFSDSKDHAVKGKVGWLLIEDYDGEGAGVRFHARIE